MLPFIPVAITGLAAVSYLFSRKRNKIVGMTAKRQIVFDHAIRSIKDPVKLRALAKGFQDAGLTAQADLLNKRAALRLLPDDVKDARRDAYRKGMSLTDPVKVNTLADAFAREGATGAAASLRDYASGLLPNQTIHPVTEVDDTLAPSPEPEKLEPVITPDPSTITVETTPAIPVIDNSAFAPEPTLANDVAPSPTIEAPQ